MYRERSLAYVSQNNYINKSECHQTCRDAIPPFCFLWTQGAIHMSGFRISAMFPKKHAVRSMSPWRHTVALLQIGSRDDQRCWWYHLLMLWFKGTSPRRCNGGRPPQAVTEVTEYRDPNSGLSLPLWLLLCHQHLLGRIADLNRAVFTQPHASSVVI